MFNGKMIMAGLALGLCAVSAASAQQQPPPSPAPNQATPNPPIFLAPGPTPFRSLEVDAWRHVQTIRAQVKAQTTPDQWRRAQQAASLINANQCVNAYKLAVIEQDEQLANSVKMTCAGRTRG